MQRLCGPRHWNVPFALVGVIHLLPLPGSPRGTREFARVRERALRDAEAYQRGGAHALIVENFGDAPFRKHRVEPHVVAAMAVIADELRRAFPLPIGINVLRNDAKAALGIAAITGADFVRVNVHIGAMVTDQGLIEGEADETLRYRTALDRPVEIWADVAVKHAAPLVARPLEEIAEETVYRGLADVLILTGSATGRPPAPDDAARLRASLPEVPLVIGSGVTPHNIASFRASADGAIVGTWAKQDGRVENPVDEARVRQLVEAIARASE